MVGICWDVLFVLRFPLKFALVLSFIPFPYPTVHYRVGSAANTAPSHVKVTNMALTNLAAKQPVVGQRPELSVAKSADACEHGYVLVEGRYPVYVGLKETRRKTSPSFSGSPCLRDTQVTSTFVFSQFGRDMGTRAVSHKDLSGLT